MGRTPCSDPARCSLCGADFEHIGKNRYRDLKRHVKKCKQVAQQAHIINNNNNNTTYSNCIINVNYFADAVKNIIEGLKLDKDFILKLTEKMTNFKSIPTTLSLFDKLHCDPEHPESCIAVIPNKSRNTMLVKEPNGEFEQMSKEEGAEKALTIFYDESFPLIQEHLRSDAVNKNVRSAIKSDDLPKQLIRNLEHVEKTTRKKLIKT